MGASLPQHLVKQRIRRALQSFARENGGTYAKFLAQGVRDGLHWSKGIRVATASNGEQFGFNSIVIGEGGAARSYGFPDLETALLAYAIDGYDPNGEDTSPLEGQPGDYKRLIGRRNPFNQTWGFEYALGLNLDAGGFDLFTKEGQTLAFRGEEADFWARELWRLLPVIYGREDRTPRDVAIARARALDTWASQFIDADGWEATTDWRAKPDHYKGPHNLPMPIA